jgi:Fe-S-cluster-containing dehydrogenase component
MSLEEKERKFSPSHIKVAYIPRLCQHCGNAACIEAAENGAAYRRPDGIVIIDPEKAVGQKQLVEACPHGAIFWNEEKNLPQKCTFCAHLLDDGWTEPRCVQTCPTSCIYFGDLDDPNSKISKFKGEMKGEALRPDLHTKPLVHYLGLPKRHVSGAVIFQDSDLCVPDVAVTLKDASGGEMVCRTDAFGDFAFNNVPLGKHSIRCQADGYSLYSREFEVTGDIEYLGEIFLQR